MSTNHHGPNSFGNDAGFLTFITGFADLQIILAYAKTNASESIGYGVAPPRFVYSDNLAVFIQKRDMSG